MKRFNEQPHLLSWTMRPSASKVCKFRETRSSGAEQDGISVALVREIATACPILTHTILASFSKHFSNFDARKRGSVSF